MNEAEVERVRYQFGIKIKLSRMLNGGMIVVVKTPYQAYIAETYGARAVIPIDKTHVEMTAETGVIAMTDLQTIKNVMDRVMIPVIARVRVGHEVEAQVMEESHVDFIDENELLMETGIPHITKHPFRIPFMGEAANLWDALKRIKEGATIIRTKFAGNEDKADIKGTIAIVKAVMDQIKELRNQSEVELSSCALSSGVSVELVTMVARSGHLPVPFFAAGGIFMPMDVALLMRLGCNGVIISSRAFNTIGPESRMSDIAHALENYNDPAKLKGLAERTGGYGPKVM
ncbi:hypothetical protein LPJ61_003897 [Coemansia biformis]|uniref:pyridoxal 5'-phosphate synthase (glutamine hydrolyzing) n=1 Tax=Coemansia biformis TaxID=1286918 RepID=A0A9W8CX99_9FUNG|nr:hypothetical protein LPJ61_003897 [Coemansia biformis]